MITNTSMLNVALRQSQLLEDDDLNRMRNKIKISISHEKKSDKISTVNDIVLHVLAGRYKKKVHTIKSYIKKKIKVEKPKSISTK